MEHDNIDQSVTGHFQ